MFSRRVVSVTAAILIAVGVAAADSGAVYTTNIGGTIVNGNVYDTKQDVYLNGGPLPKSSCSTGKLANGEYYFQVTDPSGAVLLTADVITDRQFTVFAGVISGYSGPRAVGTGSCGAVTIALAPFDDTPNAGGEYKLWVTPVSAYAEGNGAFGFIAASSKTDNFKVRSDDENPQEPKLVTIFGTKFYDANLNGTQDAGEPGLAGWKIQKVPPELADTTFTGTTGDYSFLVNESLEAPALYTISELLPNSFWVATTPMSGIVSVSLPLPVEGPNFGNVCLGAGGGRTLGFWSNKNGGALIDAADLAALRALNLRNANGAAFDPMTVKSLQSWLLNANAVNMANMLSAQLAAMKLNVLNGFVNEAAMVYAPGVVDPPFISIANLMAAADAELAIHATAGSADSWRTYQEALKNALDRANNNWSFVQAGPEACPFTSPY